ncbi:hypothetical protein CAPTEDRAFT_159439 [Capitella teleta]|uniref:Tubulin delta chain n=1 Tax=Capitella teleta TaxID=283909 RepID=R7TSU5_CAPTE|nr:hypothetical protein CAPTEDRAFT_159439 [Capitella teleta]|eukprot:ELT94556.1 hypothetical protein CAPTEDRAFT_159439 [Capitella teleta]
MSLVTLQLGQCGNQIGGKFFETLMNDIQSPANNKICSHQQNDAYADCSRSRFFSERSDGSLEARAVMVDMEQKVIAQTLEIARRSGSWRYPAKRQFCERRGSGNNWAHGYCSHGQHSRAAILDMVRREVERCDRFTGFLLLMSLAGGTGSGVGACVSEALREEYPHCFMLNQVVWPYSTGEVIVQNYNAVLTLSHLYQASDAVLSIDNDCMHRICSRLQGIKNVSFSDMNTVISHQLVSILQPCFTSRHDELIQDHLGGLLQHLVSQPDYKLLSVRDLPHMSEKAKQYSTYQWSGLIKPLRQMLIADSLLEEGINWQMKASSANLNKSLSNLVILRGQNLDLADTGSFREPCLYPSWLPASQTFREWTHPRCLHGHEKYACLLSNSQSPVRILEPITQKAWDMFASRAYVHHYLNHGLNEENFLDSFAVVEQVLQNYKSL